MSEIELIHWFFRTYRDCKPRILLEEGKFRAYAVQLGTMIYSEGYTIGEAIMSWKDEKEGKFNE